MAKIKPIIEAQNVSQSFVSEDGQPLSVLEDVNLDVREREWLCVIGPSGSGKSTLLRILAGLVPVRHGSMATSENLKPSMVFQNFALFPWLTVEENVAFGLRMAGVSDKERVRVVKEEIQAMGLSGFERHHPKELSGGMKQRVGIARALAVHPTVLFMDEPFSALDALTAERLRTDLLSIWLKRKMTIVMVTHLIEEAVELADRIAVFSARPGTLREVIDVSLPRPRDVRSQAFYKVVDHVESLIENPEAHHHE